MSHSIHGFVALLGPLQEAANELPKARVVSLKAGFGFLPVTDDLVDHEEPASPHPELVHLSARLTDWAVEQSRRFPLAYIETEYFGGVGDQTAIAWEHGRIKSGPLRTSNEKDPAGRPSTPLLERALNRILRLLGVARGQAIDEFDALGLGKHRSNEKWLAQEVEPS